LLRVVARDGEVVVDPSATLPGRGAWVHPTRVCVESALRRKAFGRALRAEGALATGRILAMQFMNKQFTNTGEASTGVSEEQAD
jgi:predicted RNA-binding protein YlxR (DUF448 family)